VGKTKTKKRMNEEEVFEDGQNEEEAIRVRALIKRWAGF
jgi:hypothetical protein